MMVADDEVYAKRLGILHLLDCLDAAIEDDDEFHTCFLGIVYTLVANSISLLVSVGNIIVDVGIELLQELVDQSDGGTSVDVVISIDKNPFLTSHGIVEPVYGHVHVLHQERVYQVGELWPEEALGGTLRRYATADEQLR